jgi:hypothetical protein
VLGLVAALEPLVAKISQLTREIRAALDQHPDATTFRSLFKDPNSVVCAATMLPRSATAASATRPTARSLPTAAKRPSQPSPANPNAPASAGHATTDSETRSRQKQLGGLEGGLDGGL